MKSLIFACALVAMSAHAAGPSRGPHGGIAAGVALQASRHHGTPQSGFGGHTSRPSVVDDYQPWPESEMRQFQKPEWTPYKGD